MAAWLEAADWLDGYQGQQRTPVKRPRQVKADPELQRLVQAHIQEREQARVRLRRRRQRHVPGMAGSRSILTPKQALAARDRARVIGGAATAKELGVCWATLINTWNRLGIELPGRRPRVPHTRARVLTKEQAIASLARARVIGRDRTAKELHVSKNTLTQSWARYQLGGLGKGHGATIKKRRRQGQDTTA